jgi:hypothetical protein
MLIFENEIDIPCVTIDLTFCFLKTIITPSFMNTVEHNCRCYRNKTRSASMTQTLTLTDRQTDIIRTMKLTFSPLVLFLVIVITYSTQHLWKTRNKALWCSSVLIQGPTAYNKANRSKVLGVYLIFWHFIASLTIKHNLNGIFTEFCSFERTKKLDLLTKKEMLEIWLTFQM